MSEGAYLASRIIARCAEDGDCLIWGGGVNHRGPVIGFKGKEISVRRAMWSHYHGGAPIPADRRATTSCGNKRCLSQAHVTALTNSEIVRATLRRQPAARIYAAKVMAARSRGLKVSDEAVRDIRYGTDHHKVLQERYGVSKAYVYAIRRGDYRPDRFNPFAGLGGLGA